MRDRSTLHTLPQSHSLSKFIAEAAVTPPAETSRCPSHCDSKIVANDTFGIWDSRIHRQHRDPVPQDIGAQKTIWSSEGVVSESTLILSVFGSFCVCLRCLRYFLISGCLIFSKCEFFHQVLCFGSSYLRTGITVMFHKLIRFHGTCRAKDDSSSTGVSEQFRLLLMSHNLFFASWCHAKKHVE